ncbi:MAG: hypothetical protein V1799_14080 [bacterium]
MKAWLSKETLKIAAIAILGVLTIFLSLRITDINMPDMFRFFLRVREIEFIFKAVAVYSLILLINMLLKALHRRVNFRGFLGLVYSYGWIPSVYQLSLEKGKNLNFRLVSWASIILVASFLYFSLNDSMHQELLKLEMSTYSGKAKRNRTTESPVVICDVLSPGQTAESFLRFCSRFIAEMESLGVKAILMDQKQFPQGVPYQEILKLAAGNVIVGDHGKLQKRGHTEDGTVIVERTSYRFTATQDQKYLSPLADYPFRIMPFKSKNDPFSENPSIFLDVAIEVLRKYSGYPDSLKPVKESNYLIFGGHKIPVHSNGWIYLRLPSYVGPPSFFVEYSTESESLKYRKWGASKNEDFNSQKELQKLLRGKVVFLINGNTSFRGDMMAYTFIMEDLLAKRYVTFYSWIGWILGIPCLGIAFIVTIRFRPSIAIPIILVQAVGVLILGHIALEYRNVFIGITFPFICSLLAMFILPASRFAFEARKTMFHNAN